MDLADRRRQQTVPEERHLLFERPRGVDHPRSHQRWMSCPVAHVDSETVESALQGAVIDLVIIDKAIDRRVEAELLILGQLGRARAEAGAPQEVLELLVGGDWRRNHRAGNRRDARADVRVGGHRYRGGRSGGRRHGRPVLGRGVLDPAQGSAGNFSRQHRAESGDKGVLQQSAPALGHHRRRFFLDHLFHRLPRPQVGSY